MKKKMLLICAALLGVVSIATAVTSANIVGYLKAPATGTLFASGPTFVQVLIFTNTTGNPTWRLGDIKPEGMDINFDLIQILDPDTAEAVLFATYSATGGGQPSRIGWYEYPIMSWAQPKLDNNVYGFGSAFLCFLSSPNVSFTYAGEVMAEPVTVDCSGMIMPLIANILPREITLGEITVEGMDTNYDLIQILDPDTAEALMFATYSATGGGQPSRVGWYEYPLMSWAQPKLDGEILQAGQAILPYFSSPNVKINFPSPIP